MQFVINGEEKELSDLSVEEAEQLTSEYRSEYRDLRIEIADADDARADEIADRMGHLNYILMDLDRHIARKISG